MHQRPLSAAPPVRLAALVALALVALSCSDTTTPSGSGTTIEVVDNAFTPESVTVAPGTAVTWHWSGSGAHNVVSDNDAFTASEILQAGSHTVTFGTSGTFNYHCTIHGAPGSGMHGTIVVLSDSLAMGMGAVGR